MRSRRKRPITPAISSTPIDYARYITAEISKWKKVVKEAGLATAW